MATVTRKQLVRRVFTDPKNYPYGFARSGDFSINESRALEQHGALIAALLDGITLPKSEEDFAYIAVAMGDIPPSTLAQRAWLKYQTRINRPKAASIYGHNKPEVDDSDEEINDNSDLTLSTDQR